ncbi:MAG TPA: hypothetical protein VGJ93_15575 [Desulfuromonadaceae bacterium]|jgi:hypothetical protein
MRFFRTLIEILIAIEIRFNRRKAAKQATRAAVRMALNGCKP